MLSLAAQDEKDFVRIEIASTTSGQITLAGKANKSYAFRRSSQHRAHILYIPLSVYSASNGQVAKDLLGKLTQSVYRPIPFFERFENPSASILGIPNGSEDNVSEETSEQPIEFPPSEIPEIPEFDPESIQTTSDQSEKDSEEPPSVSKKKR